MTMNKPYLEVIITKLKKDDYHAVCPIFPKCKGKGDTKDKAIEKLSKSISKYIAASLEKTLKSVMLSKNYSEVMLNPFKKEKDIQHQIFNIENMISQNNKEVLLNLDPVKFDRYSKKESKLNLSQFLLNELISQNTEKYQDTMGDKSLLGDNYYLFSVPVCLN